MEHVVNKKTLKTHTYIQNIRTDGRTKSRRNTQMWTMSTAVLWNFCLMDFDTRFRSVGERNIAIHRSALMAVLWDLFLLFSGRQTSFSDRCACARLIADRTTYRPLKRDCVWSLTGGSATRRCALWNDQRNGHFANQYFSLSLSLSHTHTQTSGTVYRHLPCVAVPNRIFLLWFFKSPCFDWPHAVRCVGPRAGPDTFYSKKNLLSLPGLEPCSLVSITTYTIIVIIIITVTSSSSSNNNSDHHHHCHRQ